MDHYKSLLTGDKRKFIQDLFVNNVAAENYKPLILTRVVKQADGYGNEN